MNLKILDNKFQSLNLVLIIESILTLVFGFWSYIYNQYIICLLPIILLVFFLGWANQSETLFNKNYYKLALILPIVISIIYLIIICPIGDVLRNDLYLSGINIKIVTSSVGYTGRVFRIGLIMIVLYAIALFAIYKTKDKLLSLFGSSSNEATDMNFDDIFNRFIKARASSPKRTIKIDGEFDEKIIKYLSDNNVIIRNEKGKYYIDKEQMNIIKEKPYTENTTTNIIEDSLIKKVVIGFFAVCFVVLLIMSFVNKKDDIEYTINGDNYSFVLPEDYLISSDDSSYFTLIPKDDISGDSGYIYISIESNQTIAEINVEDTISSQINIYGSQENLVDYSIYDHTNENGLLVITNNLSFENYYDDIDYIYVKKDDIYTDIITVEFTYPSEDSKIAIDAKELVDTISVLN